MTDAGLLVTCVAALAAVFVLLAALAGSIRALTFLFPERQPPAHDAAVTAAVASVVAAAYPGMRVTHVVEER
jgi:hypothetical protein